MKERKSKTDICIKKLNKIFYIYHNLILKLAIADS